MSVISVTLGTLWAGRGGISWWLYGLLLGGVIALHGAGNLFNDYFDVRNQVDLPDAPTVHYRPHPLGSEGLRMRQALIVAVMLYGIGLGLGVVLGSICGWPVLAMGVAGAAVSLCYTAPPLALKYHALGELAVLTVWGPLAVSAGHYVQAEKFSPSLLLVSMPVGILVALVLLANNLRDVKHDDARGIRTVPVVLGRRRAKRLYLALVALSFVSVMLMSVFGPLSPWSLLTMLAVPVAVPLCRMIDRDIPPDADARTARLDIVFGVLLVISVLIDRLLA
jgi:1,4-dihydroxy-2-naphthoate octaprenyltransferase